MYAIFLTAITPARHLLNTWQTLPASFFIPITVFRFSDKLLVVDFRNGILENTIFPLPEIAQTEQIETLRRIIS